MTKMGSGQTAGQAFDVFEPGDAAGREIRVCAPQMSYGSERSRRDGRRRFSTDEEQTARNIISRLRLLAAAIRQQPERHQSHVLGCAPGTLNSICAGP